MSKSKQKMFERTLSDLNSLVDSEAIKKKKWEDFSIFDLKKMDSSDYRYLCSKKIEELSTKHLKTVENLPNEEVIRLEQGEVKNLTSSLTDFRNYCENNGLSTKEVEEESVRFIMDKYKRYFFKSKMAQRIYKMNNLIASTSLGAWAYRAAGVLGTTNRFLLAAELGKSLLPIAYVTGLTFRFWSYITKPFPTVSETLDGLSHIAMSPVWLVEFMFNKATGHFFKRTSLKTEIPLNITGEVAKGSGLTWDKLNHTYQFVNDMTKNWDDDTIKDVLKTLQ